MTPEEPVAHSATTRTRLIGVVTVLVAIVLLRMTRTVTLPIVAGLVIAGMARPMHRWLERVVRRRAALLVTVLVVVLIFLSLFGLLGWSGTRVGEEILERRGRLESLHQQASAAASRFGVELPDFPGIAGAGTPAPQATTGADAGGGANGVAMRLGRTLFSGMAGIGLTIGFMALALAEVRDARKRIRRRFTPARAERIITISHEVASSVQRYLLVKSLTSALTGAATLVLTLAFGLDLAFVWGLLAFLLEYVPTIGSVLAVIPPALYAAVQFDDLARPIALTVALTVMQLFLGNYVDPKIEGRMLSLSPFVVLASIVFWAWLWGAPGALLGVPLTIGVTTVARHFDATRWIWAVLTEPHEDSDEAKAEPPAP